MKKESYLIALLTKEWITLYLNEEGKLSYRSSDKGIFKATKDEIKSYKPQVIECLKAQERYNNYLSEYEKSGLSHEEAKHKALNQCVLDFIDKAGYGYQAEEVNELCHALVAYADKGVPSYSELIIGECNPPHLCNVNGTKLDDESLIASSPKENELAKGFNALCLASS